MNELGKYLKEKREEKGISLEELQAITKIQRRYLVGIEEGNYSLMPGSFYVRAFIKQYVEAIGLNPEEIFEQFKNDIPVSVKEENPVNLSRVKSRSTFSSNSKWLEFLPKVLIGLFVIGIIAIIYYFVVSYNKPISPNTEVKPDTNVTIIDNGALNNPTPPINENTPSTNEPEVPEEEEEPEIPEPVQSLTLDQTVGSKSYFNLSNTNQMELEIGTTGQSWVSVKNGKNYNFFEGTLSSTSEVKSKVFDFSNEEEIVIIIGRPSETTITINGEAIDLSAITTGGGRHDVVIRYLKNEQ